MRIDYQIGWCLGMVLLPLVSCQKYYQTNHDLSGNNYIGGVAYLYNDYSADSLLTPLTNQILAISNTKELSLPNFLFSVVTDTNGGFVFTNLRDAIPYTIVGLDTIAGIRFYGSITNTLTNDETPINNAALYLHVDSIHQNGFVYTVTDSLGNVINGVSVWVLSSPVLVNQQDTTTLDSCLGCNFSLVTNSFGKAYQFNMAAGTYTTIFLGSFGRITLKAVDTSLTIAPAGIVRRTIVLKQH